MSDYFCLYTRENDWLKRKGIVKIGVFGYDQIENRDSTYVTSEPDRGTFTHMWKIYSDERRYIDEGLKCYLEDHHYRSDGGTEFYYTNNDSIINNINTFFRDFLKIEFSKLTEEEKNSLVSKKYNKQKSIPDPVDRIVLLKNRIRKAKGLKERITLRQFQEDADIVNHLRTKYRGVLNWCPRLGKTIASIDTILKLNCKKVCIGVPSLNLAQQWYNELDKYCDHKLILVDKNIDSIKLKQICLDNSDRDIIIITTYYSAYKISHCRTFFDLKIADEAHHLTYSANENGTDKDFRNFHNIKSTYSLSLTGSLKIGEKDKIIGNDNTALFGEIIDTKSLSWAIRENLVCDYDILAPVINSDRYELVEELSDIYPAELIISCNLMIELILNDNYKNKRIINFVNSIADSVKCKEIINILIRSDRYKLDETELSGFVNESFSEFNKKEEMKVIKTFKNCSYGIISTCYKLGEGTDIKEIDTVCISQAMQAEIRIFQSVLRAHTKDESTPDKRAVILIPIVTDNEYKPYISDDEHRFDKIKQVLEIMSESDENVMQKIKHFKKSPRQNASISDHYREISAREYLEICMKMRNIRFGNRLGFSKLKEQILLTERNIHFDLKIDYVTRQSRNNLYPSITQVEKILKNTDNSWFDLYSIDISGYYDYPDFVKKYRFSDKKQDYIDGKEYQDIHNPLFADLGDLYGKFGYTDLEWWDNCDE